MSGKSMENENSLIIPSDGKNYAYINPEVFEKLKPKRSEPITVKIFGKSIEGTTTVGLINRRKLVIPRRFRRLRFNRIHTEDSHNRYFRQSSDPINNEE